MTPHDREASRPCKFFLQLSPKLAKWLEGNYDLIANQVKNEKHIRGPSE
jgi:hypothetical protein